MGEIFARAARGLGTLIEAGGVAQAQRLVHELGQEALTEAGDSVLLHRDGPIEVPESVGIRGALPCLLPEERFQAIAVPSSAKRCMHTH